MCIFAQDTKKTTVSLFKMVNESGNNNSVAVSETSHRCGLTCLGPLTFHPQTVGDKVCLSEGGRLAERTVHTFKNGLVFSSRPVRIRERIRLRVERDLFNWHGALRVGFTTVPPSTRFLPLPCMAIPNLTTSSGHWAAPVDENCCQAGSELEFWVSRGGTVHVASNSGSHELLTGVDLSQPLWAMIDIYGQTCSIYLLGSEIRKPFYTRRSCPAPQRLTSPDVDSHRGFTPDVLSLYENKCISSPATADEVCVVCMEENAKYTLPCGHRCLCELCIPRVFQEFGTCPLCRQKISAPLPKGRTV